MSRRPFHPNEVSAGGVVVRHAGDAYEVCLVSDGRHWGLPKGNVEPDETPEQAALREVAEETGIARGGLAVIGELPPSEYVYRRRDSGRLIFKRVHQYLIAAPPGADLEPQPEEIAAAAWLTFAAAGARAGFADTRSALEAARRLLEAGATPGAA